MTGFYQAVLRLMVLEYRCVSCKSGSEPVIDLKLIMNTSLLILLLVAFVAANLPFFSRRLLWVFPLQRKHFGHYLFEWLVYFGLVGLFAYALEAGTSAVHTQGWIFYVVVLCLFAVCAFPGFVWRYFWHGKRV